VTGEIAVSLNTINNKHGLAALVEGLMNSSCLPGAGRSRAPPEGASVKVNYRAAVSFDDCCACTLSKAFGELLIFKVEDSVQTDELRAT
jgi:hypothetical protein